MVKQARQRSNLLATSAILIDVEQCTQSLDITSIEPRVVEVVRFYNELARCNSLSAQIKLIQSSKGLIRKKIVEDLDCDCSGVMESLVFLLIHPQHDSLRKYLEWITEGITRRYQSNPDESLLAVCRACHRIWLMFNAEFASTIANSIIEESGTLSKWITAFGTMATVDKDVPWLDYQVDNSSVSVSSLLTEEPAEITHATRLLVFIRTMARLCKICSSEMLSATTSSEDTQSKPLASSVDLLHSSECAGEALRTIMIVLKSRKQLTLITDDLESWKSELNALAANCLALLTNEYSHKDCVTSAAMVAICVLWLYREVLQGPIASGNPYLPQLQSLLAIVLAPEETALCVEVQLLPAFHSIDLHRSLLPLSKCAFMRAVLSVFDDLSLFTPVKNARGEEAPILLSTVLQSVIQTCYHSLPDVRLYGLQTLESWFNRLHGLLRWSNTPGTPEQLDSGADFLQRIMQAMTTVSVLLTSAWSHPTRQVNHMVPTVFQMLIDTLHLIYTSHFASEATGIQEGFWLPFITDVFSQPAQHRGRYQAMAILLPHVGSDALLRIEPRLIASLVDAVALRDVASSSTILLGAVLRALMPMVDRIVQDLEPCVEVETALIDAEAGGLQKKRKIETEVTEVDAKQVPNDSDMQRWRNLWVQGVSEALTALDRKFAMNVADYIVPEVMKIDPLCGPVLLARIQKIFLQGKCSEVQRLWSMCSVVLHARLNGLVGSELILKPSCDDSIHETLTPYVMTFDDIRNACLSHDIELRLLGLTVLTASQKTTAVLNQDEIEVFQDSLGFSLKSSQAEHRQHLIRAVKAIMLRMSESCRIACRDSKRNDNKIKELNKEKALHEYACSNLLEQPAEALMKLADIDNKIGATKLANEFFKDQIQRFEIFCRWLCDELLRNLYPGTTSDKEIISLDLLSAVIEFIKQQPLDQAMLESLLAEFINYRTARTIINLIIKSSWDKTRHMAATLLVMFAGSSPLPSFSLPSEVNRLVLWAAELMGSPRQREADAGALLLKDIFIIYAIRLQWPVVANVAYQGMDSESGLMRDGSKLQSAANHFPTFSTPLNGDVSEMACAESSLCFLEHLCSVLQMRLVSVEALFDCIHDVDALVVNDDKSPDAAPGTSGRPVNSDPLCHGVLLAIRYCLSASQDTKLLADKNSYSLTTGTVAKQLNWENLGVQLVNLTSHSLRIAMTIVAEARSDVPFACLPPNSTAVSGSNSDGVKGPIQSHTTHNPMAATYMNTNSNMSSATSGTGTAPGAETGNDDDVDDERGSMFQRAVVAAWLMVKESCALFALMVDLSPPSTVTNSGVKFLSENAIIRIGDTILDALGRLKHMGAISEAQAALQSISQTLLGYGDRCNLLSQQPQRWLQFVLTRLDNESQVFILRRSAGFAYSFLSLLRAEPTKCVPTLLPIAMNALLATVRAGLLEAQTDSNSAKAESGWRMCVHALNVTRLIILDAVLAPSLDPFISRATILAVQGFKSPHWAVRNSCMMVFAAVVQRVVDNDKHDSGGSKASTVAEFFQRFPELFPFLLAELRSIVDSIRTHGDAKPVGQKYDVQVTETETSVSSISEESFRLLQDAGENVHPSLYPILLILSKLRAALLDTSSSDSGSITIPSPIDDMSDSNRVISNSSKSSSGFFFDVSLFVPLVEVCIGQRVQKAREMSAKALASLIPVCRFADKVVDICSDLLHNLDTHRLRRDRPIVALEKLCYNQVHGRLLAMKELLDSAYRHVGSWISMPSTTSSSDSIDAVSEIPSQSSTSGAGGESMYAALLESISMKLIPHLPKLAGILSAHAVPVLHRTLLNILTVLEKMLPNSDLSLTRVESLIVLESRISLRLFATLHWDESGFVSLVPGTSLADESSKSQLRRRLSLPYAAVLVRESLSASVSLQLANLLFDCDYHMPNCNIAFQKSLISFLELLTYPVSEIREGVVLGLIRLMNKCCRGGPYPDELRSEIEQGCAKVLEYGLSHVATEPESPVLTVSLELLCVCSEILSVNSLVDGSFSTYGPLLVVADASSRAWSGLVNIIVQSASTRKRCLATGQEQSYVSSTGAVVSSEIVSTTATAHALEMLGYLLRQFITEYTVEPGVPIQVKIFQRLQDHVKQLLTWVELLEHASHEEQGLELRHGAAQSILKSKASVILAIAMTWKASSDIEQLNLISRVAWRFWMVLLRLLQDDDDDIRDIANLSVAMARSIEMGSSVAPKDVVAGLAFRQISVSPFMIVQGSTIEWCGNVMAQAVLLNARVDSGSCIPVILTSWKSAVGEISPLMANPDLSVTNTVRKIFDAEQANLYAEPLVLGKAIVQSLTRMRLLSQEDGLLELNRDIYDTFKDAAVQSLELLLGVFTDSEKYNAAYPMGITYEHDVFAAVFGSMLAFRVYCCEACGISNTDVTRLASKLRDIIVLVSSSSLHPFIQRELELLFQQCTR